MATIVFVHAHPDDESILTAGTMRALAEAGHKVHLVVATDGGSGLTHDRLAGQLSEVRAAELNLSAQALGVKQVHWLGYADSGLDGSAMGNTFVSANREESTRRLAAVLVECAADAVVGYDALGGYGHPDHLRVHEVARAAADLAGTPVVLEATMDRQLIAGLIDKVRPLIERFGWQDLLRLSDSFTPRANIAYTVDVTRWLAVKRASMRAHASQAVGGKVPRTLQLFLLLPRPLFKAAFRREWFSVVRESGANPIATLPQATSD